MCQSLTKPCQSLTTKPCDWEWVCLCVLAPSNSMNLSPWTEQSSLSRSVSVSLCESDSTPVCHRPLKLKSSSAGGAISKIFRKNLIPCVPKSCDTIAHDSCTCIFIESQTEVIVDRGTPGDAQLLGVKCDELAGVETSRNQTAKQNIIWFENVVRPDALIKTGNVRSNRHTKVLVLSASILFSCWWRLTRFPVPQKKSLWKGFIANCENTSLQKFRQPSRIGRAALKWMWYVQIWGVSSNQNHESQCFRKSWAGVVN